MTTRRISFGKAVNEAMQLEMQRDPTIILMGEDVAGGATLPHIEGENKEAWGGPLGICLGICSEFGRNRVLDTPISESAFVGAAVGAAATGLRPIAELMFVDFLGVCFDQIFATCLAAKRRSLWSFAPCMAPDFAPLRSTPSVSIRFLPTFQG